MTQATGTQAAGGPGPLGKTRNGWACFGLMVITLGIYAIVWYVKVHGEMKRHTGSGLGGGLAFVLAFFVGFVMPFVTAAEVGGLYDRAGRPKPVSGVTGCWILLPLVGPIVWFAKTNGALNGYWRALGAS